MFKSIKRIIYKTTDIEIAKQWYAKLFNLEPVLDSPFLVIFEIGECSLSLAKRNFSDLNYNENSETYWEVEDIDDSYRKLLNMGAKEHTPVKKVLNIRIAKVIDPFGNIVCITSSLQNNQEHTVEKVPSETAMIAAFSRALTAREEQGPDYLAELFLTEEGKKPLLDHSSREWAIQNLLTPALYLYFKCRTAYIDSIYKNALTDNFSQIVFLGAGYDTRAIRFANLNSTIRIFEMDAAATQNRKISILNHAQINVNEYVSFININFKNDCFLEALVQKGFDKSLKTLFILEGLTYYLTEEVIRKTLELVNKNAPSNSIICFDYLTEKIESVNQSEPFLFWMKPEKLSTLMSTYGIEIIEQINPFEMGTRFLKQSNGESAEKTLPYFHFVTGSISGK